MVEPNGAWPSAEASAGAVGRVLVTGAAGRLGSRVAALLHRSGYEVVATDREGQSDVAYPFRQADLLDHRAALEVVDGATVVVHIGNHPGLGPWPPQLVFNENITMNENVFQAAAERDVGRIVFASTVQLIGSHVDDRTVVHAPPPPAYPMDGSTTPMPANLYALSKTVTEVMLRYYAERCGIDVVALRLPLLHNHQRQVLVAEGEEKPNDIVEAFTGLSYDDAAELFRAAVSAPLGGFHVLMAGTSHRHHDRDVAGLLSRFYPHVAAGTPDLIDNTAVTEATGWQPSAHYHHRFVTNAAEGSTDADRSTNVAGADESVSEGETTP